MEIKPTNLVKGQGIEKLMAQSNYHILGINFFAELSEEKNDDETDLKVSPEFLSSPWYKDIVYGLQHLQALVDVNKAIARFIKLKVVKLCILDGYLYWKDPGVFYLIVYLKMREKKL